MSRPHDLWRSELANPAPESQRHQRTTDPFYMLGFWMIDGARTKPAWPVAIWMNDGKDSAFWQIGLNLKNTAEHADEFAEFTQSSWLKCVAVSETDWHKAIDTGKWPDGRSARHFDANEKLGLDEIQTTPASQGGNMPEGEDVDTFHAQIEAKVTALLAEFEKLPRVYDSLDVANQAAAIIEPLRGLGREGETKRKGEKQYWLDGAAKVDAKWSILRKASAAIEAMVNAVQAFKDREKSRLEAAERERQRLERIRIADEARKQLEADAAERQRIAEQMGMTTDAPSAEDIAAQAEEIAAEAVAEQAAAAAPIEAPRIGTAHGRGVAKAKTRKGKITDALALATHLITGQDADMLEYLQKRADAAARAKITLPGMMIDE